MKKTNILLTSERQLQLNDICLAHLGSFWNCIHLTGGYWRLYHHDAPGAGVFRNGLRIELLPDALYLLPPYPELVTWREQTVCQYYIHFEATSFFGSSEYSLNRIELTPDLKALVDEGRQLAAAGDSGGRSELIGFLLAASALARIPVEALCKLDDDCRIARVCDWMRNHPEMELDIPKLAARAGFVPNAFIRRFREVTGSTPHQYLLNLRYTLAARLLKSTDLKIDVLAAEIGIKDRFHFSRTFKRRFGAPPATYRSAVRKRSGIKTDPCVLETK